MTAAGRSPPPVASPIRAIDLGGHARARQVDEQDAVGEVGKQRMGGEDPQPCLADAARPGQRQQPV